MPVPLLAVDDLSVEFRTRSGTVRALDRVGFELHRGETLALVGESGSGKSVTAYAIMGILDAAARITSGRIMFGGLDLLRRRRKGDRRDTRARTGDHLSEPAHRAQSDPPDRQQIADILLRHGNVTAAQAPGRADRDAGESAHSRSGAARPRPIRSSCRAGCASG